MSPKETSSLRVAAIVPCHNEEVAIGKVVSDLRSAIPGVTVYVYDNLSTDRTVQIAEQAGAIVRHERTKGKGNVVRRAFADVDADIYLLIDGDDTYDAFGAPEMIATLLAGPLDHVLGVRKESTDTAYRRGHAAGNRAFNRLVSGIFGSPVTDMLSGYRVFSRRFVKSFPALSREFEIETELTVHSMSLRVPQTEVEVGFRDRPDGSESKLRTYRDGFRILSLISQLARHERPLLFYGLIGLLFFAAALFFGVPVISEFIVTSIVTRIPSAVLASSLAILGCLSWMMGLLLDGVLKGRQEVARLTYLQLAPVTGEG